MTTVLTDKAEKLQELCHRYAVESLEAFGSSVHQGFNEENSDLDFLVRFQQGTPKEHAERYFGLLADLQDLFQRSIDLVEVGAIRNPYFIACIESSRTLLYAA